MTDSDPIEKRFLRMEFAMTELRFSSDTAHHKEIEKKVEVCDHEKAARGHCSLNPRGCLWWAYCRVCDKFYYQSSRPLAPKKLAEIENFLRTRVCKDVCKVEI